MILVLFYSIPLIIFGLFYLQKILKEPFTYDNFLKIGIVVFSFGTAIVNLFLGLFKINLLYTWLVIIAVSLLPLFVTRSMFEKIRKYYENS